MDSSDDEETQNAEKENEELPEVTKERFYEVMSDSFKEVFSDKGPDLASKPFSLMSTFEGKQDSDTNDQDMFGKVFLDEYPPDTVYYYIISTQIRCSYFAWNICPVLLMCEQSNKD